MPENRWNRIADEAAERMKRTVDMAGKELRGGKEPALHHALTDGQQRQLLGVLLDPNAPPKARAQARAVIDYQFELAEAESRHKGG